MAAAVTDAVWLERVLRRDRAITLTGLAALAVLAWLYLLRLGTAPAGMAEMADLAMAPGGGAWSPADFTLAAVMWAVMMVAMMLPAATPMILLFAAVARRRPAAGAGEAPWGRTVVFVLTYLAVWALFSVAAAAAQWTLQRAALLAGHTLVAAPAAGGLLLLAAGAYQLTPLKYACLSRCRSPLAFVMSEWRPGRRGAVVMGVRHGLYCLGCCWVLMALLFVGGVMNLLWVAAIAAFVLVEKIVPAGPLLSRATGLVLIVWGLAVLWPR